MIKGTKPLNWLSASDIPVPGKRAAALAQRGPAVYQGAEGKTSAQAGSSGPTGPSSGQPGRRAVGSAPSLPGGFPAPKYRWPQHQAQRIPASHHWGALGSQKRVLSMRDSSRSTVSHKDAGPSRGHLKTSPAKQLRACVRALEGITPWVATGRSPRLADMLSRICC